MYFKKRMVTSLCIVASLFLCAGVFAQESENWYYNKNIKSITFVGLRTVSTLDVEAVTNSFVGKPFTDDVYSDLLNRVYALDFFSDITPVALPYDATYSAVALQFTVVERPSVVSVNFTGNKQVRSTEIREAISIKESEIFISSKILLDERKIRDLYLKKGYTNIKVTSSSIESEEGVAVTFAINEGRSSIVTEIRFQGNDQIPTKNLKGELTLKEATFYNKGAFQESALELDKQNIVLFYQNKGYVDVVVQDVVREVNYNEEKNRDELILTFVLKEGNQYYYQGTTLDGNVIFSDETLLGLIKVKEGAVFNQSKFQEGFMAIADLYYENGYTSNGFMPDIQKNTDFRTITCKIIIVEKPRSHIENILIRGNKKTKEYVIRRELPIDEGDIFSKTKLTTGLRSLYNLQFFSAIVPDIVQGSEENLVDVIFNLEEQSTTSIEFGVTFSGVTDPSAWPVSLFAKWQDTNVFGTGKTISAGVTGSNDEQNITFGYSDSWFFNKPLSFSVDFKIAHTAATTLQNMYLPSGVNNTDYYMNYDQYALSLSGGLGKRWVQDFGVLTLSGGISNSYVRNVFDSSLYEPVDTTVAENEAAWGVQNSVWGKISFDARDINYDPSKGWFFSQQLTWNGLIPSLENQFYLRTDTKAEKYFTLLDVPVSSTWNLKFVLAGYTGFSFLFPSPNTTISSTSRLYVDGMFNGRGWNSIYSNKGNAMWSSFLELRMPIAPGVFALDFFADAVALKDKPEEMFTSLSIEDFHFSFGPGMRFSLPQFPLRLLLANTFEIKNGQVEWNDKMQFVLSFNITNR
jgi:outer membrane protein insertion porin family